VGIGQYFVGLVRRSGPFSPEPHGRTLNPDGAPKTTQLALRGRCQHLEKLGLGRWIPSGPRFVRRASYISVELKGVKFCECQASRSLERSSTTEWVLPPTNGSGVFPWDRRWHVPFCPLAAYGLGRAAGITSLLQGSLRPPAGKVSGYLIMGKSGRPRDQSDRVRGISAACARTGIFHSCANLS
jgi:hypothetical protein